MVDNSCLLQSLGLQILAISVGTPTCNPRFKEMDISFDFDYQFIAEFFIFPLETYDIIHFKAEKLGG